MEVILLERIESGGQMGDVVTVKPGFARNYLLPRKKALRATEENKAYFKTRKVELEANNLENRKEAEAVAVKLDGLFLVLIRQAGDSGQLYGSVNSRDIAAAVGDAGFGVERNQIRLERPIKTIGLHSVQIALHPEVAVMVTANVALTAEEASIQEKTGKAVIGADDDLDAAFEAETPDAETDAPAAEEMLEDSAVEALRERQASDDAAEAEDEAAAEARERALAEQVKAEQDKAEENEAGEEEESEDNSKKAD